MYLPLLASPTGSRFSANGIFSLPMLSLAKRVPIWYPSYQSHKLPITATEVPYVLTAQVRVSNVRCEASADKVDSYYMKMCVEIARTALGCTSPNPMVGCVIVKDGKIIGQGFHPKAGEPHAEVFALKDAGILAKNAAVYVNLEPCNHHGRTPPCTEALIRAEVRSVVIGMVDPNPVVASKGVKRLKAAGIDVKVGVEEELCHKLNEAYAHRMVTGVPLLTLRYSLSINGQLQNELGEGAEEACGYYSKLLKVNDGIIISRSLQTSGKCLKAQEISVNQPPEIVLVRSLTSSQQLCDLPLSRMIVFRDRDHLMDTTTMSNFHQLGIEIITLDILDLSHILSYCGYQQLCSVLIDIRDNLFGSFEEIIAGGLQAGIVQKVMVEILPYWGRENPVMRFKHVMGSYVKLKDLVARTSNNSVIMEGYVCKAASEGKKLPYRQSTVAQVGFI